MGLCVDYYGGVCGENCVCVFFFQAEDGIRDLVRSRGLGDVYKRQPECRRRGIRTTRTARALPSRPVPEVPGHRPGRSLSLIHI